MVRVSEEESEGTTEAESLVLDGAPLSIEEVVAVARHGVRVLLATAARARLATGRALIEHIVEHGDTVYGVNTGFGSLARVRISPQELLTLQRNLVRSHAA